LKVRWRFRPGEQTGVRSRRPSDDVRVVRLRAIVVNFTVVPAVTVMRSVRVGVVVDLISPVRRQPGR